MSTNPITEAEWLASQSPVLLLKEADSPLPSSQRKLRLYAVACCRRAWGHYAEGKEHAALTVCEEVADGQMGLGSLSEQYEQIGGVGSLSARASAYNALSAITARDSWRAASGATYWGGVYYGMTSADPLLGDCNATETFVKVKAAEHLLQMALLCDVFGNPFRPVTFSPDWRTTTAVQLAQQMYDSRDFSTMPILADALQDAGCTNADILDHCRAEGPHVRGCWVVDLVLGKG